MSYYHRVVNRRDADTGQDETEPYGVKGGTQDPPKGPQPKPRPIPPPNQPRSRAAQSGYIVPQDLPGAAYPSPGTSPGYTIQRGPTPYHQPQPSPAPRAGGSYPQRPLDNPPIERLPRERYPPKAPYNTARQPSNGPPPGPSNFPPMKPMAQDQYRPTVPCSPYEQRPASYPRGDMPYGRPLREPSQQTCQQPGEQPCPPNQETDRPRQFNDRQSRGYPRPG